MVSRAKVSVNATVEGHRNTSVIQRQDPADLRVRSDPALQVVLVFGMVAQIFTHGFTK